MPAVIKTAGLHTSGSIAAQGTLHQFEGPPTGRVPFGEFLPAAAAANVASNGVRAGRGYDKAGDGRIARSEKVLTS